jgi:transcriptional regulator with XRE-family HTH domain
MLTDRIRNAVKTSHERQYRLAQRVGVHPSVLSAWLNGISHPKPGDPRVVALGNLVGVPEAECFEDEPERVA